MKDIIVWLECCLRKYIDSIETEKTLSDLKNNLAKQTIYSEQQIYQNAFQQMEQNQNNSLFFFVVMTCLTQNNIQRFTASIAFCLNTVQNTDICFQNCMVLICPFPQ